MAFALIIKIYVKHDRDFLKQAYKMSILTHKAGAVSKRDSPKFTSAMPRPSAAIYSLEETAKANGLDVYVYLHYLLLYMPSLDSHCRLELPDDLMPWSQWVQNAYKNES